MLTSVQWLEKGITFGSMSVAPLQIKKKAVVEFSYRHESYLYTSRHILIDCSSQPNVTKIIDQWNMRDELEKIASANTLADIRNADGSRIALIDMQARGIAWYETIFIIANRTRHDILLITVQHAGLVSVAPS